MYKLKITAVKHKTVKHNVIYNKNEIYNPTK